MAKQTELSDHTLSSEICRSVLNFRFFKKYRDISVFHYFIIRGLG